MTDKEINAELEIQRRLGIACLVVLGGFCAVFMVAGSLFSMMMH
jgi:hypothetical protein